MADNIITSSAVVSGTGVRAVISATDSAGIYTLNVVTSGGDSALIIPGVVQASAQNLVAPLLAKNNGDGTYSLVVTSE